MNALYLCICSGKEIDMQDMALIMHRDPPGGGVFTHLDKASVQ